jgi:hypothetical protein
MAFHAWHGSRNGTCGFYSGFTESDVAWFSFDESQAYEFARLAWKEENRLPTLCRVSIEGSPYDLFDPSDLEDEDVRQDFLRCLKNKGVSDYWVPSILAAMENYEFIAFDPNNGGTDSSKVAECVKELGFIGWKERESYRDDPQNFGLFDPGSKVTVLEEIKLCPECGSAMEEEADHFECESCEDIYKVCDECGEVLEWDNDDEAWVFPCNCDMRSNPMTTVNDLESYMEYSTEDLSDEEAIKYAAEFYPESLNDPEKFLSEHPERAGYARVKTRNFIFVGPKGRMLRVEEDQILPVEGNIFDFKKLKGLSVAPDFRDSKIPMYVGYVAPFLMTQGRYEEAIEYEDEFYSPDEDDVDEIFFQLRDGNHRTIAAFLSDEPYAYVQISANDYQDYTEWVEAGRPEDARSIEILKYLDENLF